MAFRQRLRGLVERCPPLWDRYARWRAVRDEGQYRAWREKYARLAPAPPPAMRPTRGPLTPGAIRTFAVIPGWSWHRDLLPELESIGPCVQFDYGLDMPLEESGRYNARFFEWRERSNRELLRRFEEEHARAPIDWLFAYAQGDHLLAGTVRAVRDRFGVPTVNLSLDDKNSWEGREVGGQIAGSRGLVAAFDAWWTTSPVCVDWIHAEGGRAVCLPEGCTPSLFPEGDLPYSIPVSFVGGAYGARPTLIRRLRSRGIPVRTFGPGWDSDSSVSAERKIEIYRTSQVNLGHGGIGYSESVLNVKGRDFEVPCAGGGVYLTTFNPDLADCFRVGEEILCWHSIDDLVEQVRRLLGRPDDCRAIARRARLRATAEHRWRDRFLAVLRRLGLLPP